VTIYIDGVFEHSYVSVNNVIDSNKHYNTLHLMDGRSRIATERVGTDTDDSTPAVKYNVEDHLGTSSVTLASNGSMVNREEYYPFGETCFGAFAKKRYRFTGKEKDNETGLYYYGARYYAAWTCRFVSVDPLANKYPQLTPYNYAANDPIGDLDIDGMQNTKTPEGGGSGDAMNFSDMLPKGNDHDSTKLPVVLQMEQKANGGLATGKELAAPDTVGSVEEMIQFASKKLDEAKAKAGELLDKGIETVKEAADKAKKEAFRATATGAVDALDWVNDGEWSTSATDDDVNAYQLAYQWVHGTGPDQRTFTENSTMGQQMLQADYVQRAMYSAGLGSITGGNNTADASRSLRNENPALYVVDFTNDVTGANPARGFHGSIGGTVTAGPAIVFENYTAIVPLTIELSDRMTATSGTRASATVGGYEIENPTAVYKTENPYGPNGQFRTIEVTYTMRVIAVMSVPSPLRLPIR
jgi:RHS repeat-associated protein